MGQLIAGATALKGTPVGCTEPSPPVSPVTSSRTQEASGAVEPAPSGPTAVVPQTKLLTSPSLAPVIDTNNGRMPDGVATQSCPLRERRPPKRFDI